MTSIPPANDADDTSELFIGDPPCAPFAPAGPPLGYAEYEIDVEAVLRSGLPARFTRVLAAPLTAANVLRLPAGVKGGYLLTMDGQPVYAGKTDTRHGFRDRLGRHVKTVQHRIGLDPSRIGFKAIRIPVFSSFDAESILIEEMRRSAPGALPWNDSGFGNNDPGHNRETQEPANFDKEHPIDIDRPLTISGLKPGAALAALAAMYTLKTSLPYLLRYQTDIGPNGRPARASVGHTDQRSTTVTLPPAPLTARTILREVVDALPPGWIVTRFPDRVILYKESTTYRYALETLPSP